MRNDSRSSSRVREHGSFLLVSQLHVAIQTLWSRCLFPRALWTDRWIVHFQRVSRFLFDLRLRFRLRLCLDLNVQQTLAHNSWLNGGPFTGLSVLKFVLSQLNKTRFSISWALEPDDCSAKTSLPAFTIGFLVFGSVCWDGSLHYLSNFGTQFFHPVVFKGNLRRRSRWRKNFLVNDFSSFHHDSLRDTISWECVAKDRVRSCLIELKSFSLSKFWCRPNTPCFDVSSMLYACTVQDAVHSNRSYQDPYDFCSWDRRTWRIPSACCSNFVLPLSILNWWWNVNWLHIQRDKCTWRNRPELIHCLGMKDQWDCVPNDLEELGEFLVQMDQCNIEIFSRFLRLLPLYSSTFHQTNVEIAQIRSEKILYSPEFNRSIFFSR